jgi:Protein tyrosine and serine/threonine kinase
MPPRGPFLLLGLNFLLVLLPSAMQAAPPPPGCAPQGRRASILTASTGQRPSHHFLSFQVTIGAQTAPQSVPTALGIYIEDDPRITGSFPSQIALGLYSNFAGAGDLPRTLLAFAEGTISAPGFHDFRTTRAGLQAGTGFPLPVNPGEKYWVAYVTERSLKVGATGTETNVNEVVANKTAPLIDGLPPTVQILSGNPSGGDHVWVTTCPPAGAAAGSDLIVRHGTETVWPAPLNYAAGGGVRATPGGLMFAGIAGGMPACCTPSDQAHTWEVAGSVGPGHAGQLGIAAPSLLADTIPAPAARYLSGCSVSWGSTRAIVVAGGMDTGLLGSRQVTVMLPDKTLDKSLQLQLPRAGTLAACVQDVAVFAGGHNSNLVDAFNVTTRQRIAHSSTRQAPAGYGAGASADRWAFAAGGGGGCCPDHASALTDVVDAFDATSPTLSAHPHAASLRLSSPRALLASADVNTPFGSAVAFAGGVLSDGSGSDAIDVFFLPADDLALPVRKSALLSTPRMLAGGGFVANRQSPSGVFVVAGGATNIASWATTGTAEVVWISPYAQSVQVLGAALPMHSQAARPVSILRTEVTGGPADMLSVVGGALTTADDGVNTATTYFLNMTTSPTVVVVQVPPVQAGASTCSPATFTADFRNIVIYEAASSFGISPDRILVSSSECVGVQWVITFEILGDVTIPPPGSPGVTTGSWVVVQVGPVSTTTGATTPPIQAPVTASSPTSSGDNTGVIVVIVVVVLVLLCVAAVVALAVFAYRRRRRSFPVSHDGASVSMKNMRDSEVVASLAGLHLERKIGEGNFGTVYAGTLANTSAVAAKEIRSSRSPAAQRELLREAAVLTGLKHPNIVAFLGAAALENCTGRDVLVDGEPGSMFLVMELCHGSLLSILRGERRRPDGPTVNVRSLIRIACQAARGLAFLHGEGVLHRDVALRNLLAGVPKSSDETVGDPVVSGTAIKVCISDFGLSSILKGDYDAYYASPESEKSIPIRWSSPEAILRGRFSREGECVYFSSPPRSFAFVFALSPC